MWGARRRRKCDERGEVRSVGAADAVPDGPIREGRPGAEGGLSEVRGESKPGKCWWEGREFQGEEAAGAKGLGQGCGGRAGGEGVGDEVRRPWRCRAD